MDLELPDDRLASSAVAVLEALPSQIDLPPSLIRQIRNFALIGVVSTLAYVLLYAWLRGPLNAQAANALSLVLTAIGNTAANRRLTFGVSGRGSLVRHHAAGLIAFGAALLITTVSVTGLQIAVPNAGRALELVVLVGANGAATIIRFILLRFWIAPPEPVSAKGPAAS